MNEKTHMQLLLENLAENPAPPPNSTLPVKTESSVAGPKKLRNLALQKIWRANNREKIALVRAVWRKANPDKEKAMNARCNQKRKKSGYFHDYATKRYAANQESFRQKRRDYYWNNHEKELASIRRYGHENRSRIIAQRRQREQVDPQYAIGERLRRSLVKAVLRRNTKKADSTFALLGCSLPDFVKHIEAQFAPGMNWDNRRLWHIDHEIPIAAFELTNAEEQKWAFNWQNLRPLWARANHQKSDTLPAVIPSWLPSPVAARVLGRVTV